KQSNLRASKVKFIQSETLDRRRVHLGRMSPDKEFSVSTDAIALVKELITKYNWEPVSDVKYYPGTEAGDGYACKHVAVEITRPAGDIKLFIKYSLDFKESKNMVIDKFFANETYFYKTVYPTYVKFISARNCQNGFREAPKCYGFTPKNTIALENLRYKGFNLHDRRKTMDQKHINLVLKTLAKFHATSFAFKDQDPDAYQKLADKCAGDFFSQQPKDSPTIRIFFEIIQEGLDKLDPEKDKKILDKCNTRDLMDSILNLGENLNEYSIISQGDCWCNNVMFQYEEETKANPIDVMLIDWQVLRSASPAYDLSYFFYTIASQESLTNLNSHLEIYYEELSEQIRQLGSNPEILYPEDVFRNEWRRCSKYGFALAFVLLKFMLANKDEVPKLENIGLENLKVGENIGLFPKYENEEEYLGRVKMLAGFMVDNDYI
ncbi:phosphotransferase, partial [Oryctes borbonicus]